MVNVGRACRGVGHAAQLCLLSDALVLICEYPMWGSRVTTHFRFCTFEICLVINFEIRI